MLIADSSGDVFWTHLPTEPLCYHEIESPFASSKQQVGTQQWSHSIQRGQSAASIGNTWIGSPGNVEATIALEILVHSNRDYR